MGIHHFGRQRRHAGKLADYATTTLGITVQIVSKLAGQIGFVVLPRGWCVERTFSWINAAAAPSETTSGCPSTTLPPSTGP